MDDKDGAKDEDTNNQNDEDEGKNEECDEEEFVGDSLQECVRSFEELSKALKVVLKKWKWGPLTMFLDSVNEVFSAHHILLAHTRDYSCPT